MAEDVRSCGRLSWLITRPVLIARNIIYRSASCKIRRWQRLNEWRACS